jgi:hypothetical protein
MHKYIAIEQEKTPFDDNESSWCEIFEIDNDGIFGKPWVRFVEMDKAKIIVKALNESSSNQ